MRSMKLTPRTVAVAVAFAAVAAGGIYWALVGGELDSRTLGDVPPAATDARTFSSAAYGFAFDYPSRYYLASREVGTVERPQLAVVLVEDTPENRDVVEGRSTEAREGPPGIMVDAYANASGAAVREWLEIETNWKLGDGDLMPTMGGEEPGYAFAWSGLYEGGSVVVGHGDKIYVLSVTWLDQGDRIVTDYQDVLKSVRFAE